MPSHDLYDYETAAEPEERSHWSGIGTLSLLCLVSVLALTLLGAYVTTEPRPMVWNGLFTQRTLGKSGIRFAGVTLGMPRSAVEKRHPDLVLNRIFTGRTVGTFRAEGAAHTLWFTGAESRHKVYRMRIERTYEGLGEYEILARFGRRHGNPVITNCGRRIFASGQRCHYQWLTKGGVPLDVHSRVIKDDSGISRTVLTIIAVDALLEEIAKK